MRWTTPVGVVEHWSSLPPPPAGESGLLHLKGPPSASPKADRIVNLEAYQEIRLEHRAHHLPVIGRSHARNIYPCIHAMLDAFGTAEGFATASQCARSEQRSATINYLIQQQLLRFMTASISQLSQTVHHDTDPRGSDTTRRTLPLLSRHQHYPLNTKQLPMPVLLLVMRKRSTVSNSPACRSALTILVETNKQLQMVQVCCITARPALQRPLQPPTPCR